MLSSLSRLSKIDATAADPAEETIKGNSRTGRSPSVSWWAVKESNLQPTD